ncbi:hypothetical protein GJ496_002122 [Pomphorhynchus laevis]|nr:hypothetical protein GJ496_002122 [Pomphorhynchus laevis]
MFHLLRLHHNEYGYRNMGGLIRHIGNQILMSTSDAGLDTLHVAMFTATPAIDFKVIRLGDIASRPLLIVNPDNRKKVSIEVNEKSLTPVFYCECVKLILNPGEEHILTMTCVPNELGPFRHTISFKMNDKKELKVVAFGSCVKSADKQKIRERQIRNIKCARNLADSKCIVYQTPETNRNANIPSDSQTPVFCFNKDPEPDIDLDQSIVAEENLAKQDSLQVQDDLKQDICVDNLLMFDRFDDKENELYKVAFESKSEDGEIQERALLTWVNQLICPKVENVDQFNELYDKVVEYLRAMNYEYRQFVDRLTAGEIKIKYRLDNVYSTMSAPSTALVDMLLNYEIIWVRIAVKIIFGMEKCAILKSEKSIRKLLYEIIAQSNSADVFKPVRFVLQFIHLLDFYYSSASDCFKPALFRKDSSLKSSKAVLEELIKHTFEPSAQWIKLLIASGISCGFCQSALLDYSYKATNLEDDFRDGIRIAKIVAVLTGCRDAVIEANLKCPALTLGQKLNNIRWAFQYLQSKCNLELAILPKELALGYRRKTSSFLWSLIFTVELNKLVDAKSLLNHMHFLRQYRTYCWPSRDLSENCTERINFKDSIKEISQISNHTETLVKISLLLRWAAQINTFYNLRILNLNSSFNDGRAFCHLISFYCPEIICLRDIENLTTYSLENQSSVSLQQRIEHEYNNFSLFTEAIRTISKIPAFTIRSKLSPNKLDQRCVLMLLANLYARLIIVSKRMTAARTIWLHWTKYKIRLMNKRKEMEVLYARFISILITECLNKPTEFKFSCVKDIQHILRENQIYFHFDQIRVAFSLYCNFCVVERSSINIRNFFTEHRYIDHRPILTIGDFISHQRDCRVYQILRFRRNMKEIRQTMNFDMLNRLWTLRHLIRFPNLVYRHSEIIKHIIISYNLPLHSKHAFKISVNIYCQNGPIHNAICHLSNLIFTNVSRKRVRTEDFHLNNVLSCFLVDKVRLNLNESILNSAFISEQLHSHDEPENIAKECNQIMTCLLDKSLCCDIQQSLTFSSNISTIILQDEISPVTKLRFRHALNICRWYRSLFCRSRFLAMMSICNDCVLSHFLSYKQKCLFEKAQVLTCLPINDLSIPISKYNSIKSALIHSNFGNLAFYAKQIRNCINFSFYQPKLLHFKSLSIVMNINKGNFINLKLQSLFQAMSSVSSAEFRSHTVKNTLDICISIKKYIGSSKRLLDSANTLLMHQQSCCNRLVFTKSKHHFQQIKRVCETTLKHSEAEKYFENLRHIEYIRKICKIQVNA